MKSLGKILLFSFLLLFVFQRIIDNESICGGIGVNENDCIFSINSNLENDTSQSEEEDHICICCPCNYILIVYPNLYLNKIYTQFSISYTISNFFNPVNFDYLSNLSRPPKSII